MMELCLWKEEKSKRNAKTTHDLWIYVCLDLELD